MVQPLTEKEIDGALEVIPASVIDDYDTWYKIGMALKVEGHSFALWDKHSRRGSTYSKNGPYEMDSKWQGFAGPDKKGVSIVTAGFICEIAAKYGWEHPRKGTGESVPERIRRKKAEQKNCEVTQYYLGKEEDDEPAEEEPKGNTHGGARVNAGRPSKDPADGAEVILEEFSDEIVHVRGMGVLIANERGQWELLTRRNEDALGQISRLLVLCGDGRTHGDRYLIGVLTSLRAAAITDPSVRHLSSQDVDKRNRLLPTVDGGYDLGTGEKVSSKKMREFLQIDRGYHFTIPPEISDYEEGSLEELVMEMWYDRWKDWGVRIAAYLLGILPVIDVVVGESGVGKGVFMNLLARALPVITTQLSMLQATGSQGRRWTVIEAALGKHLVVLVDEADKEPKNPIDVGQLNKYVDPEVMMAEKGEKAQVVPRKGTVMFVGGDDPKFPFHSQGMERRFRDKFVVQGKKEYSQVDWGRVANPPEFGPDVAAQIICRLIIDQCLLLWQNEDYRNNLADATSTDDSRTAAEQMLKEGIPEEAKVLREILMEDSLKRVASKRIKELAEEADSSLSDRDLQDNMRIAFPNVERQRTKAGMSWKGVSERPIE